MITTTLLPSLVALLAAPQPNLGFESIEPFVAPPTPVLYALPQEGDGYDFSYTFLELGYAQTDIDNLSEDADNYYLAGSLGLGMFQIVAGYENTDLDVDDLSADTFRLGAGAHFGLTPTLDLQGDISWLFTDLSSNNFDDSGSGYEVRGGLRWMALPWSSGGLELAGNLLYRDHENALATSPDQLGWELQARAHFISLLSVGASYIERDGDDATVLINARVSL